MNDKYLEQARERIASVPLLINVVSRRVQQLIHGARPLVKPDDPHMAWLDVALKEIAEGKLTAEVIYRPSEEEEQAGEESVIAL